MTTRRKVILGGKPAGWGFGGFEVVEEPTATEVPKQDIISTVDQGWLGHTRLLFAAFIKQAAPPDQEFAIALCEWLSELLCEYMEKGIRLEDLILCARKVAARLPISNESRYSLVGIVASAATSATPERTRAERQGKTSRVISNEAMKLVYLLQRTDDGAQVMTTDEAVAAARATLAEILPPNLLPAEKTLKNNYSRWLAEQGHTVQRPAVGTPTFRDK